MPKIFDNSIKQMVGKLLHVLEKEKKRIIVSKFKTTNKTSCTAYRSVGTTHRQMAQIRV